MAKDYKIFISHAWDHDNDLKDLQDLLNKRGYFNVEFKEVTKDDPIDSENAKYIKRVLSNKIEESDIILGLAGMYASYSDWMEWELDKALEKGKNIIGVIPWGQQKTSNTVTERSKEDVRWNTDSIVNAIRYWAD
ncbi:TIR domain-containing protein [Lentisphaerota bacterium WC36G]|nr:TIR domain-containing protein [Lentisphaerae bacterium WC36]